MLAFPTPIQYSFGIPTQNNKTREREIKGSQRGKEEANYPYLQMT
jgi:hypothetical protein